LGFVKLETAYDLTLRDERRVPVDGLDRAVAAVEAVMARGLLEKGGT
jgi:hypothetical protein